MGSSNSKYGDNEALRLCKDRVRCMKQAVDSRYALSAAHLSYIQSLRNVGIALRRFVEIEILGGDSQVSSISEVDNKSTPMHSSYASPSPSNVPLSGSPLSPRISNLSYMKVATSVLMTVTVDPSNNDRMMVEESVDFPPPPPPPLMENEASWDFFFPTSNDKAPITKEETAKKAEELSLVTLKEPDGSKDLQNDICKSKKDSEDAVEEELHEEREDASEFITHRAKDFLSSIKEIEHRFLRAAECGHEISRMLETNRIKLGDYSEIRGKSNASLCLTAFQPGCCKGMSAPRHESSQDVNKVITWNRTTSSVSSSSSKVPLAPAAKDDVGDSCSDFVEEFCMISGSHKSTLDRLYAWERKLYEEVKASESIRKAYDRKCTELRHLNSKELNLHAIDKTRATVKDLHSRLTVTIQAVNSISKRIEKMRDDELQPQLLELLQGFVRMWKAMLECHHAQYITVTLAYHVNNAVVPRQGEAYKNAIMHLQNELDCFRSSFLHWAHAQKDYIEAIDIWIQKCIHQPRERTRRKLIFPPRRAILPPIFVLCRDWSAGVKSLPTTELCDSIEGVINVLRNSFEQQMQERIKAETEEKENEADNKSSAKSSNLESLQISLTRFFDQSTKFSEASLKVHEDVKQGFDTARTAYVNSDFR